MLVQKRIGEDGVICIPTMSDIAPRLGVIEHRDDRAPCGAAGSPRHHKIFKETIAGALEIDWLAEDLEHVRLTILTKHNA